MAVRTTVQPNVIIEKQKKTYWDICSLGTSYLDKRTTVGLIGVGTKYSIDGND